MSAFRTFNNELFKKNLDVTVMKNIKTVQKSVSFFNFS